MPIPGGQLRLREAKRPTTHDRATPASWLQLRGRRGLRELVHGLVDWMPRLPAGEIEPVDEQAATLSRKAHDPALVEFQRMLDGLS